MTRKSQVDVEWLGVRYKTILPASSTNGSMCIIESIAPPDSGPPRHVHEAEDETFVILSGELEIWLEGRQFFMGPGEATMVPRGAEHTFRVIGKNPCRKYLILSPGGFEGFFAEMAAGKCRIPEDMAKVEDAAARYNLRFTGPPLHAF